MSPTTITAPGPWIAGAGADPAGRPALELAEPATGAPLASGTLATEADVATAVAVARAALAGPWGRTPPTERARLLHALADRVAAQRGELAELEARNVGKAIGSVKAEIGGAVETLRFFGSALAAHGGRAHAVGSSLLTYSLKQPVGVCALVVPWNYPLLMTTWKLAPALAAGCAVVLKPDAQTPLSALALARLAEEVGVPAGVVNVLPGDGALGARLVTDPGVDKVSFTGSTATGAAVMRACAEPIKRLTLELGGKSPNVIFADADLDDAIASACWSIFYAAGQSCEARSRLLVQRSIHDDVVARLVEATGRIVVGDPLEAGTQVGSLISAAHRERVHGFVARARERDGAQVLTGGVVPDGPGAFYPPTVVAGVRPGSELEQDEVFGPVVAVQPFDDEDDAVRLANDTRYGLFASVWSGDSARVHRMARRIDAGMIGLNMPYTAFAGIGFGGFKQSGFGRELSLETLDAFSETKSVLLATGTRPANPFRL